MFKGGIPMAVRTILKFGDLRLRKKSKAIEKIDDDILELVQDLKDTLYSTTGIGLAAPQIGVLRRAIYIDLKNDSEPILLLNPIVSAKTGMNISTEGCLSYTGYEGIVKRPEKITVSGINLKGEKVEIFAGGLLARAFCHEIDHLNGILYTDRAKKVYKTEE